MGGPFDLPPSLGVRWLKKSAGSTIGCYLLWKKCILKNILEFRKTEIPCVYKVKKLTGLID